jgi:DNA-directed RNA polymerase specialized sigma24 family protein
VTLINEGRDYAVKHDIHTVKRAINGDARAFEELPFLEEKNLYYKALPYVGKKEDALDAIQETSCKAFLSIGQLQNPEFFSTWLFKILIRECYKLLKNRDQIIPYEENGLVKRLDRIQDKEIESFHLSDALAKLNQCFSSTFSVSFKIKKSKFIKREYYHTKIGRRSGEINRNLGRRSSRW